MDKELKIMVDGKEVSPELAEKIQELISRSGSHNDKCGCGDCKKISKIKKFRGFCKGIGDLFVSTEPLKTEEVSEAEADEIEANAEVEKADAEVEKADADAKKTEDGAKKVEDEAKKADADTKKTETEDEADAEKSDAKKKENFFLELFYTDSGKILNTADMEKIKKLPIGGDIHVKAVKRFMLELEGGFVLEVEKIPASAKNREFLHVASKTLVSKDEAELYKSLGSNPKEDPIVKVIDVKALIADDNGLMKYVNI